MASHLWKEQGKKSLRSILPEKAWKSLPTSEIQIDAVEPEKKISAGSKIFLSQITMEISHKTIVK
jgi:hypothetical protein